MKLVSSRKRDDKTYLEDNTKLSELIKELVMEYGDDAAGDFECWKNADSCMEEIECVSRSGFIAATHNCGGWTYRNFTDVNGIIGSGRQFASNEANKEIQRQYDYNLKCVLEEMKLKEMPEDEDTREKVYEAMIDPDSTDSIMIEVRIMYHGVNEDGKHEASVSAAVNWEGPYHRSSISWSKYKCESAKEIDVEFTNKNAKSKLTKALKTVCKNQF